MIIFNLDNSQNEWVMPQPGHGIPIRSLKGQMVKLFFWKKDSIAGILCRKYIIINIDIIKLAKGLSCI